MSLRPLHRVQAGVWTSGRWTFMRHFSDPHPQRWYAYLDDDTEPMNDGSGNVRLSEAVAWAERHDLVGSRVEIQ